MLLLAILSCVVLWLMSVQTPDMYYLASLVFTVYILFLNYQPPSLIKQYSSIDGAQIYKQYKQGNVYMVISQSYKSHHKQTVSLSVVNNNQFHSDIYNTSKMVALLRQIYNTSNKQTQFKDLEEQMFRLYNIPENSILYDDIEF